MADHDFWDRLNTEFGIQADNRDGDWKTATDAQIDAALDLSGMSAGDKTRLKELYDIYARQPYKGILTDSELDELITLWAAAEP